MSVKTRTVYLKCLQYNSNTHMNPSDCIILMAQLVGYKKFSPRTKELAITSDSCRYGRSAFILLRKYGNLDVLKASAATSLDKSFRGKKNERTVSTVSGQRR